MDCYCDYDPAEFYSSRVCAARKEYRCDECARKILPGEQYEKVTGKWAGTVSTFRTCSHCVDIRQFVENSVPCFCWAHGNTDEDAREAVREAYWRAGSEVKGLFMGYGRLVVARNRVKHAQWAAK